MKTAESVLVGFDGPSKCGTTTFANAVVDQAQTLGLIFDSVATYSAGNAYRAATRHVIDEEARGRKFSGLTDDDEIAVGRILMTHGIHTELQTDPVIAERVNRVAQMPNAQRICSGLFSELVARTYWGDGTRANLVVVDARDPYGVLTRNDRIGERPGQIRLASFMPVFIDTPPDLAARRMGGDYNTKLTQVLRRRREDAERPEFPVTEPEETLSDFGQWEQQFRGIKHRSELAIPLRFDNGEYTDLQDVSRFAGELAIAAQGLAFALHERLMVSSES